MFLLRDAVPLVSLFFYSAFAVAQILGPVCTVESWKWTYNSVGINPCAITAWMMSTCNGGAYVFYSLPAGYSYSGPDGFDANNLCYCNTVAYSLFSACGACQGREWINWSFWATNCTKILPPSSFPNPVPSGISVSRWAVIDITYQNDWNASKSYAVGDSPELGPGSILGPSSASVTPTPSSKASSTGSPTPPPSKSSRGKVATIACGVLGFIVVVSVVFVVFYLRRRSRARAAASVDVGASQPQRPLSYEVAPVSLDGPPITRLYDPDDPSTFPGHRGEPHSQDIPSQVTMSSNIGTGNTLADTQSSLPQAGLARGYHGLPTV